MGASVVVAQGLSCLAARGIIQKQGSNPCLLHWQADLQPLGHQGIPRYIFKSVPQLSYIRKLWYIYTMEYYSAIKKNTFESVLMRWEKLEPIIQSEVSQKEKHQYSILTHIYGI